MSRLGFGFALVGVPLILVACGGNAQQNVVRTAELDRKVQELRAQTRRDRVKIRELERELLDAQTSEPTSLEVTAQAAPPRGKATRSARKDVEVIFEDVGGVIDGDQNQEHSKVLGTDPNGIEIRYAGDALANSSVRPRLSNIGSGSSRLASLDTLPPVVTEDDERLPVTTGTVPKVAAQVARVLSETGAMPTIGGNAQDMYQKSMEAIELGEYTRAIGGLQQFLKAHPNHELADNAQYWMGESYYVQKQYSSALSAFRGVVDKFPLGNKVPDALLKVGYCLIQLGDKEAARRTLERVKTEFPDTNPASLAARKLQELKG